MSSAETWCRRLTWKPVLRRRLDCYKSKSDSDSAGMTVVPRMHGATDAHGRYCKIGSNPKPMLVEAVRVTGTFLFFCRSHDSVLASKTIQES